MQTYLEDAHVKVNSEDEGSPASHQSEENRKKSADAAPSEDKDSDNQSTKSPQNQLVLYDPGTSNAALEIERAPDSSDHETSSFPRLPAPNRPSRPMTSIGAFTVQCARCMQWRLIPTKETYERLREHILEEPFYCENAQEWKPGVTCADPPDILQDGSRVWAIDKPNIAQPPSGWERLLRIRGEGSSKFADVYYVAPSGKRLRSMVEVQKYLLEHPDHVNQGVSMSQFSFQTPRPLQENYVRKRPARLTPNANESTGLPNARPLELVEVNPLSWVSPAPSTDLQLGMPEPSTSYRKPPSAYQSPFEPPPQKRRSARSPLKQMYSDSSLSNQTSFKLDDPPHSRNTSLSFENLYCCTNQPLIVAASFCRSL